MVWEREHCIVSMKCLTILKYVTAGVCLSPLLFMSVFQPFEALMLY